MKRKIAAILSCIAMLFMLNSPGAEAAVVTDYCDTPVGNYNDQVHQGDYYHYVDGGGYWRARLTAAYINNLSTAGWGTDWRVQFGSDTGIAYDSGHVFWNASYINTPVPSQANARLIYHPYVAIWSGANDDGYPMCLTSRGLW